MTCARCKKPTSGKHQWNLNGADLRLCGACQRAVTQLVLDWIAVGPLEFPRMEVKRDKEG